MIDYYRVIKEMDEVSEGCTQGGLHGQEQEDAKGSIFAQTGTGLGNSNHFLPGARISLRGAKRVEPPVQGAPWNALAQMPPSQRPLRINLQDLKAKLSKILGPKKEKEYSSLFSSFLSQRLTKAELDKRLPQTIGRDNICLHNQIVKAIFTNAICGEAPPPPSHDTSKPVKGVRRKPAFNVDVGSPASPLQVSPRNAIPASPRKGRSGIRDRKSKQNPGLLGAPQRRKSFEQGAVIEGDATVIVPDGLGNMMDVCRPTLEGEAEQPLSSFTSTPLAKRARLKSSSDEESEEARFVVQVEGAEDEEEDELASPVRAPLGLPLCVQSVGAACQKPHVNTVAPISCTLLGHDIQEECLDPSDLPDTATMQRRMERIAIAEAGLEGVNEDSANLLNHAVDIHLRRVIKACIELVQSRRSKQQKVALNREKRHNGLCGIGVHAGGGVGNKATVSVLDFRVAMELNPQQLGEDWPTQLERISLQAFEYQEAG